ncbi:MAG: DUF2332 domain-containing protein [bacterium]|nr:DUF2332 domain-containing protein [bacterium]
MPFDLAAAFREQAMYCDALDSPFTAAILRRAADDVDADGWVADLLARDDWTRADAAPLRWTGALHAAVLGGRAPALAALYPPQRSHWDADAVFAAATAAYAADPAWFAAFVTSPPQTNETRRAICLLPGFLAAAAGGGPLHCLEVGASAGLNTNWDRFAYRTERWSWGSTADAAPRIDSAWHGPAPAVATPIVVASRAACDRQPLDVRDPEARDRLRAYLWPDQPERLERFDRAVALAVRQGTRVERESADVWLARRLAGPLPEGVTIVYHSIAWQYFPADVAARARAAIEAAGAQATRSRRLAWVRFELDSVFPGDRGHDAGDDLADATRFGVDLLGWPGGERRHVARVDPHARWVDTSD